MKKRIQCITCMIVTFTMLFGFLPTDVVMAEAAFQAETLAEIEAAFSVRNANKHVQSEYASGGVYVKTDGVEVSSANQITASDFDMTFSIDQKGTYSTYLRALFPSGGSDLFFIAWDDGEWTKVEKGSTGGQFQWIMLDERKLSAGKHILSIARGDSGGYFDAVYVCPKGMTPPEDLEGVKKGIIATGYTEVHRQQEIPVVNDSYLFQAEDLTLYSPWVIKAGKGANGTVISPTKHKTPDRDVAPTSDTVGKVELRYIAGQTATYSVWLRIRVPSRSNQLIYVSYNTGSYAKLTLPISETFVWYKQTERKLTAGQEDLYRLHERYKELEIDEILITTGSYTPEGVDGTPIVGSEDVMGILEGDTYAAPEITPPAFEHPRVLFTKEDIPRILENMEAPQNASAVAHYKELLSSEYDGTPNGREYHKLPILEAYAFDYALTGNIENGRKAVDGILKYLRGYSLDASNEATRDGGNIVFIVSEIYDWCYDLINIKEKYEIIEKSVKILHGIENSWPPYSIGAISGHGNEAMFLKDDMAFAIATYDERPDYWNFVGGLFYQDYVPVRDWYLPAGWHYQGATYGMYRHRWDTWAYYLITGMGAPEPFDGKQLADFSYQVIYQRRPDGQYFREGDNHLDSKAKIWSYWNENTENLWLDQAITDDPYIKNEAYRMNPYFETFDGDYSENASPIAFIIRNNPNTEAESFEGLPLSRYFGSPVGLTVARTGWNDGVESPDAMAVMKVGEYRVNGHQHADSGAFQLYYKGILASRSGVYQGYTTKGSNNGSTQFSSEHVWMYASKSIAYNTMLIFDPSEPGIQPERRNVSDGGQRVVYGNGEVKTLDEYFSDVGREDHDPNLGAVAAQEIDPKNPMKPAYTYLKGDLTKAYLSRKCEHYDRSFMFLNLFDEEVPAALIVYDRVTSTNPDFKKTWLLHTQEKPEISDHQIVAERTLSSTIYDMGYNGKLTVDNILPKQADITVVGSEEEGWSNIRGTDWTGLPSANKTTEGNSYRVEISPANAAKSDTFLNVLQVTDAGTDHYMPVTEIETETLYGVQISDRVVTFSKSATDMSEIAFDAAGSGELQYTLCDVEPGTWEVTVGDTVQTVTVTNDGKVLAFTAGAGRVSARKVNADTKDGEDIRDLRADTERKPTVRIDQFFVYTKEAPELSDGRLCVPLSLFVQYFELSEAKEGDTVTVTNSKQDTVMTVDLTGNTALIKGNDTETSIDISLKNGTVMVPVRAVAEGFGGAVEWDNYAKTAYISTPPKDYSLPEGYAKIVSFRKDEGKNDAKNENLIEHGIDGNFNTHWGTKGIGRYMDLEFEKETTIENAEILFNPNNGRNALFEIQVSTDGKTFTTVFEGAGDGSVEAGSWEKFVFDAPVKAKWVRYIANGSNLSEWNGVKEIRFKEGK